MTGARWVVFAYHTFGARALETLLARGENVVAVVTHPDDPDEGDWFPSVAGLARSCGVKVLMPASANEPAVVDELRVLDADVFLSVWYRQLLGDELLRLPRVAALNLHGSLLPAYRGRAPVNWVLVNGEPRTGVTLHHMVREADAGDIVAQEVVEIAATDTALTLYLKVVAAGVDLLMRWYPAVLAGHAPRVPQDHARATVCRRRRPEDGRVEWDWPAKRIADMVRAVTHPYPGAFAGDGPERVFIWSAEVASNGGASAAPGTILSVRSGQGVTVATGAGGLLVKRLQPPGEAEQAADVWATRTGRRTGDPMTTPR